MENKPYVGNLAYTVADNDLGKLFAQYGTLAGIRVMMDRDTARFSPLRP